MMVIDTIRCGKIFNNVRINQTILIMKYYIHKVYDEEKIQSLVLDVFDFNLDKFESEYLKGYDYDLDTTDPFGEKPWLVKDKIKDILIF